MQGSGTPNPLLVSNNTDKGNILAGNDTAKSHGDLVFGGGIAKASEVDHHGPKRVVFRFEDCSCRINSGGFFPKKISSMRASNINMASSDDGFKYILKNVSAEVTSGHFLAIMGPSGSGLLFNFE